MSENYAVASVNSMLSSINSFFSYLEWYELRVKTIKVQKQIFVRYLKVLNPKVENLYEIINQTGKRVKEMIKLVTKVDTVSQQVEEIFGSQAEATEHIVNSTEELNNHTENVSAGTYTVAENAGELQRESKELMDKISKFRVE